MPTEQYFKELLINYLTEQEGTVDIESIEANKAKDGSLRGFFYKKRTYYALDKILELSKGMSFTENGQDFTK